MSFTTSWDDLLDAVEGIADDAALFTPLSRTQFRVTGIREHYIVVKFENEDETRRLHRDQFGTLYRNVTDTTDGFEFDRLPPNAEPYAAVLTLHPDFEIDGREEVLAETETASPSSLLGAPLHADQNEVQTEQAEPSIDEMLDNMGDVSDVECPIEGCRYSHRSASSVARHVSGSSTAKHIWGNTSYAGWRDFVRKHGGSPG